MFNKNYTNFVRASGEDEGRCTATKAKQPIINGDEARRMYLEEVNNGDSSYLLTTNKRKVERCLKINKTEEILFSNKDLFLTVQNNDVAKVTSILDRYHDKINIVDDYGWSLLMIACQANSIETVQELLKRGIDTSIRDKAGNSARSLVIKNKNYVLANILLNHRDTTDKSSVIHDRSKRKSKEEDYTCDICSKTFLDKDEHLSSTLHNIVASKGKKIRPHYVIPTTNRGFQLLLKGGWDRDSGLGRNGTGKKYPIKTEQKKDRKGLGHKKIEHEIKSIESDIKYNSKKMFADTEKQNKRFEINFRREFY